MFPTLQLQLHNIELNYYQTWINCYYDPKNTTKKYEDVNGEFMTWWINYYYDLKIDNLLFSKGLFVS